MDFQDSFVAKTTLEKNRADRLILSDYKNVWQTNNTLKFAINDIKIDME